MPPNRFHRPSAKQIWWHDNDFQKMPPKHLHTQDSRGLVITTAEVAAHLEKTTRPLQGIMSNDVQKAWRTECHIICGDTAPCKSWEVWHWHGFSLQMSKRPVLQLSRYAACSWVWAFCQNAGWSECYGHKSRVGPAARCHPKQGWTWHNRFNRYKWAHALAAMPILTSGPGETAGTSNMSWKRLNFCCTIGP